jgi:ribonuclease HI
MGSFFPTDNRGGWGFVVRDRQGTAIGAGAGHLRVVASAAQAEAVACTEAVHAEAEWGIMKIIIETDSWNLVHATDSMEFDLAPEGVIYRDICALFHLHFTSV